MLRLDRKNAYPSAADSDRSETNEHTGYAGGQDKKRFSQEMSIRRIREATESPLRPDQRAGGLSK